MKCNQCGAEFEGKFCTECGAKSEGVAVQPSQSGVKKRKKPLYKRWWFYALLVIAAVIVFNVISRNNKGEKIEWASIELNAVIPEPPSNKGTLYDNSDERFNATFNGVSDEQYNKYQKTCEEAGFNVDAEKSTGLYNAYNSDGYSLMLSHYSDEMSVELEAPMKFSSITWPTSVVGKLLPVPESLTGKFSYEHDDNFYVYIGETSRDDYAEYAASCAENGFNVDYSKGDTYYYADNADGYHISVKYEGNNIMSIHISAPKPLPTEATSQPQSAEPAETAAAEIPAEETSVAEAVSDSGAIRPEFKSAMDSYEAFMDEYCAFMKKYSENPSDLGLIADYAEYMKKYAEAVKDFEALDNNEMNAAEAAYYVEVSARVSKKLLDAAI